jgi:hypothetical protein
MQNKKEPKPIKADSKRKTAEAVVSASAKLQAMTSAMLENPGIGVRVNPKTYKELKAFMRENVK